MALSIDSVRLSAIYQIYSGIYLHEVWLVIDQSQDGLYMAKVDALMIETVSV